MTTKRTNGLGAVTSGSTEPQHQEVAAVEGGFENPHADGSVVAAASTVLSVEPAPAAPGLTSTLQACMERARDAAQAAMDSVPRGFMGDAAAARIWGSANTFVIEGQKCLLQHPHALGFGAAAAEVNSTRNSMEAFNMEIAVKLIVIAIVGSILLHVMRRAHEAGL